MDGLGLWRLGILVVMLMMMVVVMEDGRDVTVWVEGQTQAKVNGES